MPGTFRFDGLKARRERQGLSLETVARRSEASEDVLRSLEDGGTCSLRDACEISRVLRDDTEDRARLKALAGQLGLTVVEV